MITDPRNSTCSPLAGRRLLFVMAADAEYGPALKVRFKPLKTGVGPIEAALSVGIALTTLSTVGALPDLVVCLGSAGSRTLEQGAVYQVSSVSWRDIDASPLGFPKGITPFLDYPAEARLSTPVADLATARLSTGSDIVTGSAYDGIDADMVDMETYAVARACARFGVPMIGLRGISDGAADLHHYDNWTALLHVIDINLADAVDGLAEAIGKGWHP